MKVIDLARYIAPKARIKITGIRPGEKIHETLITEEESSHTKEFDKYFVIEPEFHFWDKREMKKGKKLPSNFRYSSNNNDWWLTEKDVKEMLNDSLL